MTIVTIDFLSAYRRNIGGEMALMIKAEDVGITVLNRRELSAVKDPMPPTSLGKRPSPSPNVPWHAAH